MLSKPYKYAKFLATFHLHLFHSTLVSMVHINVCDVTLSVITHQSPKKSSGVLALLIVYLHYICAGIFLQLPSKRVYYNYLLNF